MIYLKPEDTTIVVSSYCIKENIDKIEKPTVRPGMDVVIVGSIGMEGMLRLTRKYRDELYKKFGTSFMNDVVLMDETSMDLYACDNTELVQKFMCNSYTMDKAVVYEVETEGVFAGLYELSKFIGKGIDISIPKIPVWQQVIEIAEFFDVNPYKMDGTGALIIVCNEGSNMVEYLTDEGVLAQVVGTVTDNNDKIARNGEEVRYLEPSRVDELKNLL